MTSTNTPVVDLTTTIGSTPNGRTALYYPDHCVVELIDADNRILAHAQHVATVEDAEEWVRQHRGGGAVTTTQPTYTSAAALGRLKFCVGECEDAIADLQPIKERGYRASSEDDRVALKSVWEILHTIRNRLRGVIDNDGPELLRKERVAEDAGEVRR